MLYFIKQTTPNTSQQYFTSHQFATRTLFIALLERMRRDNPGHVLVECPRECAIKLFGRANLYDNMCKSWPNQTEKPWWMQEPVWSM